MFINSVLALNPYDNPSTILFFAGLISSLLVCTLLVLLEPLLSQRNFQSAEVGCCASQYQRFRQELISTARHVGFTADEIQELCDNEFLSD